MAVSDKGYIRPSYDDILEGRIALAKELWGEDIDTSNSSTLGKFIRLSVQDWADALEDQELIYYARFPHTATGHNLDRLMPFAGITRNPATRAEHEIRFTGTPEHEIEVGFLVGTTGDEQFYLLNSVTLDENGEGVGTVACTEAGTIGNVTLGTITEIVNPDVNVFIVEHTNIEELGMDVESDADLRKRFEQAIAGSGSATAAAIKGNVMRVNGVRGCLVVENKENVVDAEGRPPHSFETYAHASELLDQQIAEAIFEKKPLGIKSYGDVAVEVADASGGTQTVYFSRVAETPLYIKVSVATNSYFELDGVEQIKTALIAYIESLTNGEDVIYTSLYKHIFGVVGVKDVTNLEISTDGVSYSTSNIIMAAHEIAAVHADNIAVEVTAYADR